MKPHIGLIAEEYNVMEWGGAGRARAARDKRAKALWEEGHVIFKRQSKALNSQYDGFQLVAFVDNNVIRPVLPPTD